MPGVTNVGSGRHPRVTTTARPATDSSETAEHERQSRRLSISGACRGRIGRDGRYWSPCRSAPNCLEARPLLLLVADPVGRLGGTSGQLPGTPARIGEDRVDQPRH